MLNEMLDHELKRFQEMLKDKLEVARQKAAQVNPNSSTDVPDGVDPETWKYMPELLPGVVLTSAL